MQDRKAKSSSITGMSTQREGTKCCAVKLIHELGSGV